MARSCHGATGIRANAALIAFTTLVVMFPNVPSVRAQTFKVLYTFTGGTDGADPGGLTVGRAGELYGVANSGGNPNCYSGCGTIFELLPKSSQWDFTLLHTFQDKPDGAFPFAPMVFGPDGLLYGTTPVGGTSSGITAVGELKCAGGCGTIFRLKPPPPSCRKSCSWNEKVVYRFPGGNDGSAPGFDAPLVFDPAGNIYGTTQLGGYMVGICNGNYGCGVVFELMPSGAGWVEKVLYSFNGAGGAWPVAGLILDQSGNLYGTSSWTAFQLTPSGLDWNFNLLLQTDDTIGAGLSFDESGNLYGATEDGGPSEGGTAFKIMPSNGWETQMIYGFAPGQGGQPYFPGPGATMIIDNAGNLYGTTTSDGAYGQGSVFKLSPTGDGSWSYNYTDLHDFTGGSDGGNPSASMVPDNDGNLYGTAEFGGAGSECQNRGCGVIFEITP
jgi:uncharacterized repeat protein (TIGR03803 family)